jgi:hypothetical protein
MWVVVLLFVGLFFLINGLFFVSYQQSNHIEVSYLKTRLNSTDNQTERLALQQNIALKEKLWPQIWSFSGTEPFKTVSVSIVIPLILAALGGIFKIDNAIEQRIRDQRQKGIETQKASIQETAKMWNDLYCIITDIRFYVYDKQGQLKVSGTENTEKKKAIEDILKQIENFASTAEEVVNTWHFVFPELSKVGKEFRNELANKITRNPGNTEIGSKKELEKNLEQKLIKIKASGLILVFINVLYDTSSSVAYYIRKIKNEEKEEKKVNERIKPLQDSLGVVQDVIKDMAHQSMLGILKYSVVPIEGWGANKQSDDYARSAIKSLLGNLFNYAKILKKMEETIRPLPKIDVSNWELKYTEENIIKLAEQLGNISINSDRELRKEWGEIISKSLEKK